MRSKQPTLFFSFSSASGAMEAEALCAEAGVPGRLVPTPREITAGCGLAWMCPPEHRQTVLRFFREKGLEYEGLLQLDYYR